MKPESQEFLKDIKSDEEQTQLNAWMKAGSQDPEVVVPLSELLVSDNMKIAKAADEALQLITHSVGVKLSGERWYAVVDSFMTVLNGDYPTWSKKIACRHLSKIADERFVPAIAKWLDDDELREEAVFCLERIPGRETTEALCEGLKEADDDFKPRILAALGHRADPTAIDAVLKERRSRKTEVSLAAFRALAHIGREAGKENSPEFAQPDGYTETQLREFSDSCLLYIDRMLQNDCEIDALSLYGSWLDNAPQEHHRCAAIVGIANYGAKQRTGSGAKDAAIEKIKKKTDDKAYIVRITARKALESLKA